MTRRYHEREVAERRAALQRAREREQSSDSEEDTDADDEGSSSEDEEKETENIPPHSTWTDGTQNITLPSCTRPPGSLLPRHRPMTVLSYLQCFLTGAMVATIAANTNLYAASKLAPAGWATTAKEMWRYIGVHIFMGIVDLPAMDDYWEGRRAQKTVVETFSRNRFRELQRYFHISKPLAVGVRHTVIDRLEPLYTHCRELFNTSFHPPQDLTVDETMVRFKGRSAWKTIIKNKPTPIGYKIYTLASHGYLLNFAIYQGKGGYAVKQGVIHHSVIELVKHWAGRNHLIYFDNLYTSPALCDHLYSIGFRTCGTFRPNRSGLPSDFRDAMKQLRRGEMKTWKRGELQCLVWRDKQPVLMLSNHHRVDDMITLEQDRGPNRPKSVTKPKVVLDYNVGKCGVDTVDQLRQYYAIQRKSYKNWPPLAWWLIDMCIINAYSLWCLDTRASISQQDFRDALVDQIEEAYPIHDHTPERGRSPPPAISGEGGHWPHRVSKRGTCVNCSKGRERRSEVRNTCKRCGVYLCQEPCMEQWHEGRR
jgi:hypothetical protein